MTAARKQTLRTPPRVVVRVLWMLHRAVYRVARGRFGLSRPLAGARFGMMRLATVGRRSRRPRIAILGYYEDGPNVAL